MAYEINFCETKEQLKHLAEVASGKVDGSPSGADIDESTLSYTGQVRRTLPKLIDQFDQQRAILDAEAAEAIDTYRRVNAGDYSSGPLLLDDKFTYATYSGGRFYAVSPPYTTDPVTFTDPNTDANLILLNLPDEQFVRTVANQTAEQILDGEIFPQDYDQALPLGAQSSFVDADITILRVDTGLKIELLYLWEPSGDFSASSRTITDISANIYGGYDVTVSGVGTPFEFAVQEVIKDRKKGLLSGFGVSNATTSEAITYAFEKISELGLTVRGVGVYEYDTSTERLEIDATKDIKAEGFTLKSTTKGAVNILNTPVYSGITAQVFFEDSQIILTAPPTGVEVGQVVSIVSDEDFEETNRTAKKHFAGKVHAVSGATITLDRNVNVPFTNGFTHNVNFYNSGKIELNIDFISDEYTRDPLELAATMVTAVGVKDLKIKGSFSGAGGFYQGRPNPGDPNNHINGITLAECVDPEIEPVFDSVQYGVLDFNGTNGLKTINPITRNSRHTVDHAIGADNSKVINGKGYNCFAAFDSHETALLTEHIDCQSFNDEIACKFRGRTDYVTGQYDKCSFITDPGVAATYTKFSPIGSTLIKYFSGVMKSLNRCEISATKWICGDMQSNNVIFPLIDTSTECHWVGVIRMYVDDSVGSLSGVSVVENSTTVTVINDMEIYGPSRGAQPVDALTTKKIALYIVRENAFVDIKRYKAQGNRSGIWFNGQNNGLVNIIDADLSRNGEALRVVNGGTTTVGKFNNVRFSENFEDGPEINRLRQAIISTDALAVQTKVVALPPAIAKVLL